MTEQEEIILRRAVRELRSGMVVNLGIGLPTKLAALLPPDLCVIFHSENGLVGLGPPRLDGGPDDEVIDAGGQSCELVCGAACFDSVMSFAIVRGGHLDVAVLGAFEVSIAGDLANWTIPGKLTPGMGGGMELAQKARRVIVVSRHVDKGGRGKLVERCSLPLTARQCVDTLITDRAVFRRSGSTGQLCLVSVHPVESLESVLGPLAVDVPVAEPLEPWGS